MDKDFYLQGTDKEKEHFSGNRGVSFEWNIIYKCNAAGGADIKSSTSRSSEEKRPPGPNKVSGHAS